MPALRGQPRVEAGQRLAVVRDRSPGHGNAGNARNDRHADSPHHPARRRQVRRSPDSGPRVRRDAWAGRVRLRHAPGLPGRGGGRRPIGRPRVRALRGRHPVGPARQPRRSRLRAPRRHRSPTSTPRVPGRTSRPRWRATSGIGRCSSARTPERRSTRVGPTTCRSSCRTSRGSSRAASLPLDVVFVNATPPDDHGFCSLGTSVEAMHAAIRAAKTVVVQLNRSHAADARRELHPRRRHRPRVEVDVPPYVHAEPRHRRHRAADRRARRRARAGSARRSSWGSAPSRRRPRWP